MHNVEYKKERATRAPTKVFGPLMAGTTN